jgi:hypothetical protein
MKQQELGFGFITLCVIPAGPRPETDSVLEIGAVFDPGNGKQTPFHRYIQHPVVEGDSMTLAKHKDSLLQCARTGVPKGAAFGDFLEFVHVSMRTMTKIGKSLPHWAGIGVGSFDIQFFPSHFAKALPDQILEIGSLMATGDGPVTLEEIQVRMINAGCFPRQAGRGNRALFFAETMADAIWFHYTGP